MKKIIKKYWGIVLIVTLLASMFVTAAPVSADDLEFSAVGTPGGDIANPYQIADTNVQMVKVAPGGTIFTLDIGHDMLYRSTNGGYTWKATDLTDYEVADFVFSPSFETDSTMFLVVNDGADVLVLRSVNGGVSFTQLGGAVATGQTAQAIDVEPTYMSGVGMIVVGTSGDAYVWGLGGALNWVMLGGGVGENVLDIAFSPLYPIDSTIFAVTNDTTNTYLQGIVQAGTWNNLSGTTEFPVELGTNANVNAASMVFPSDFNASLPLARNIFVGIDGDESGVFRMNNESATTIGTLDDAVYSLTYAGTSASGTLYVGLLEKDSLDVMVYKSSNPSVSPATNVSFSALYAGLTGDRKAAVATNGSMLYVGTSGNESAFNVSTDGMTFRQNGQIDTEIDYTTDLKVVSPTQWYMATAADTGYFLESLWLTTDGGATYQRIATIDSSEDWAGIALSQNFATDKTMYFFSKWGGTEILYSSDAGATWSVRAAPYLLSETADIVAADQYTLYIADYDDNFVYKSVNNGWTWAPLELVGGSWVNAIKYEPMTGAVLVSDGSGNVYVSTNGSSFTKLGTPTGGGWPAIAFDSNYDTNSTVYASDGADIYRYVVGTSTSFKKIYDADGTDYEDTWIDDIAVAPDGVLYAARESDGDDGGFTRILNPTATAPLANSFRDGLSDGDDLYYLQITTGSNIVMAISDIDHIVSYTDTLSQTTPSVTAPADGAIVPAFSVTVSKVTGATYYQLEWGSRSDLAGATLENPVAKGASYETTVLLKALNAPVPAGSTIYYHVRVFGPVYGPWSATYMVNTQLTGDVSPNAPDVEIGAVGAGSTQNGGFDVEIMPTFFWGGVVGATSYEFQLATDAGMANLLVDMSGANALGNVTSYSLNAPLDYGMTYYWRVRALSANSETDWSIVSAFKVMDEPPASPTPTAGPTITLTTQPAPTITFTQPAATTTTINIPPAPATEEIAPAYIWVIIIIGAVLVIAVVVLIVRTRRTV